MVTRIISGLVCAIIAIAIIVINNPIVDSIFITVMALLAIYEFYNAFKNINVKPIKWIGYIFCLPIMLLGTGILTDANVIFALKVIIPSVIVISFAYVVLTNLKRNIIDIAVTFMGIIYIPVLFSFVKSIAMMENGRVLIWYIIFGAVICDMAAYFIGKNFGKHKLCEKISPKKTIEGSIAGIIAVIISFAIFTICANNFWGMNLPIWYMIIIGVIASIIGQFGDLFASIIKRHCNIKDYGNIIPGHGGILDRFDSILFVAPVIYILLQIII